jgi:signal transduction histidine kinase
MALKKDIPGEKQILASFISKLPEAIVICDAQGRFLLHDRQAEAYLLSNENSRSDPDSSEPNSMVGKSITSFMDKDLIEHALDEINQKIRLGSANPVSRFLFQKGSRVFSTQIVPVLTGTGLFNGFVVILGDITQQNQAEKQVDGLLTMLSKNARSPMASIRAAVEAMKSFPAMDEERTSSLLISSIMNPWCSAIFWKGFLRNTMG